MGGKIMRNTMGGVLLNILVAMALMQPVMADEFWECGLLNESGTYGPAASIAVDAEDPGLACSSPESVSTAVGLATGMLDGRLPNEFFKSACESHDYCYRHGSYTYGKTRKQCDDDMLADMKAICNNVFDRSWCGPGDKLPSCDRNRCKIAADIYWSGLRSTPQAFASFRSARKRTTQSADILKNFSTAGGFGAENCEVQYASIPGVGDLVPVKVSCLSDNGIYCDYNNLTPRRDEGQGRFHDLWSIGSDRVWALLSDFDFSDYMDGARLVPVPDMDNLNSLIRRFFAREIGDWSAASQPPDAAVYYFLLQEADLERQQQIRGTMSSCSMTTQNTPSGYPPVRSLLTGSEACRGNVWKTEFWNWWQDFREGLVRCNAVVAQSVNGSAEDGDGDGITDSCDLCPDFKDRTNRCGFVDDTNLLAGDLRRAGRGAAWADIDGDADPDLYFTGQFDRLFLNQTSQDGRTFEDVASLAGIQNAALGQGIAFADYDNDGDQDIYVAYQNAPNRLYRNQGDGTFVNATTPALADAGDTRSVAWADFDNDGNLDLYIGNYGSANRLYRNLGDGTLAEVTLGALGDDGNTTGVAWADYDGDGDVDLYLANYGGSDRLLRNDRGEYFTDVTRNVLGQLGNDKTTAVAWGDYNNDGLQDLYLVVSGAPNRLFRNAGARSGGGWMFEDVTAPPLDDPGDGRSASWVDYDNDGDLDIYLVNARGSNRLFSNNGSGDFKDVAGTASIAEAGNGPGAAWADYDADGDLDVFVVNSLVSGSGGGPTQLRRGGGKLLTNNAASGSNWLQIELVGSCSNRDGIGARLHLHTTKTTILADSGVDFGDVGRNSGDLPGVPVPGDPATPGGQGPLPMIYIGRGNNTGIGAGLPLDFFLIDPRGISIDGPQGMPPGVDGVDDSFLEFDPSGMRPPSTGGDVGNRPPVSGRVRQHDQYREVRSGDGSMSQGSVQVNFGIPFKSSRRSTVISTLTIQWPSGVVQTIGNDAVGLFLTNTRLRITEPSCGEQATAVDLALEKTASDQTMVLGGSPLVYTLTVNNTGSGPATGVRLIDTLSPNITVDDVTASQGGCTLAPRTDQGRKLVCGLGSLSTGETGRVVITTTVNAAGSIGNRAVVRSLQEDTDTSNNYAEITTTVFDPDQDSDQDTVPDYQDNCPGTPNPQQSDLDGDGAGDACDADRDGDGLENAADNCPDTSNSDQLDQDGDGLGDACDPVANPPGDMNDDGVLDAQDYQVFRSTLGKCLGETGYIEKADYDADGCITYADYRTWYGLYLKAQ